MCICPCVGGAAFLVQSADVADADGTLVPAHTMRPVEGDVPSRFDGAVEADDVMIADGPEATGTVPAVDVAAVMSCPARVAEQWMMMVSFIAETPFFVLFLWAIYKC